ncbi:hypothetical protein QZH41_019814 [Actinostola sp. cb2023]|nr:hypothetical protein QZH41_019814 [Actinostola sp. cb2023]
MASLLPRIPCFVSNIFQLRLSINRLEDVEVDYAKVFGGWKEIALTMRSRVFEDNEEEDIDIFDLKWNKYSLTTMQRNCYFCGYAFAMPKRPYKKASVSVSYIDDLPRLHYDESTWDGIFIEKKKQLDYLEKFSANQTCQAILFPATPQFYAHQTCQAILFPATPQFSANQTCRAILFPATPQFYAHQTCRAILFPATPQFSANQTCQAILFPATPQFSANQTCRAILFPATPQFYAHQTC